MEFLDDWVKITTIFSNFSVVIACWVYIIKLEKNRNMGWDLIKSAVGILLTFIVFALLIVGLYSIIHQIGIISG